MLNIAVKVEVSDTTMFIMAVKARLIKFLNNPFPFNPQFTKINELSLII